jgi:hypothetical protein
MRSLAKGVPNVASVCLAKLLQQASEDRPYFPSLKYPHIYHAEVFIFL